MSNEATITANIKVTGLSSLVQANEAAEKLKATLSSLNGGGTSFSGLNNSLRAMESHIKRITTGLKELNTAGNQNKVGNNLAEGMSKANEVINKTKTSLKEIGAVNTQTAGTRLSEGILKANTAFGKYESSIKASQSAERELANAAKQVASAEKEATSAAEKGANARKQSVNANNQALREEKQAQQAQASMMSAYAGGSNGGKKEPGKFMSALKESVGMFTLGQLGANAVMGGVEGIKNVFKGGLDYISTQQASQVSWASNARSVNQLLGRNISNKQANNFASGMVTDVGNLARSAGNDYKQVSDAALAFYATGAGVSTAGNKKKTLQLTNDMLNLQDAGGLNDEEMGRFIQSVAKSLDQDKIDGKRLQQLKQFNPNIDEYLNKAYKKRTGHDAKSANDYTGDDLVNAIHAAGTAPGVADASRRMNQSLAGVQRSIKYGSIAMAGEFEKKLATSLNKAFGGDGKLFSKITGWMNDPKKTSAFVNKAAETTSGVITTTGKIGREAWNVGSDIFKAVQPYAKSFGQGFVSEIKSIASGVKSAYGTLKGYASKLSNLLPKGATSNLQGLSNALGKITGGLVGLRFLNKLPGMSGLVSKMVTPVMNLIGKIPVVGKTLSGVISKITGIKPTQELSAAGKMQSAADTMMSAANRMNGGNGNNRLGNEINGPKGNRAGTSFVDSNGRVIDIADGMGGSFYRTANGTIKRTFKGNGNFSGTFNPYLGMDYVPGTKLGTRMGRYHNGRVVAPAPRSTALIAKGEELLESATAAQIASESSRVARRVTTGIGGRASLALTKLKGNTLIKLGNAGQFVASHGGNFIARGASGIKNGLGALGKSGAGLNLAFGAIDLANSFATTKSGTLARHKAVGGSVGATAGSIAGGALGTLLDPFIGPAGTMIGATAGGMLGNVIGNWAGGLFGGSKTPTQKRPSHSQQVATAQAKAQQNFDRKNYANDYATRFGVNSDGTQKSSAEIKNLKAEAKRGYNLSNRASKSTSAKTQEAALNYQQAVQNGDYGAAKKYQAQMQKRITKEDASDVSKAQRKVSKATSAKNKAYKDAYKANLEAVKRNNPNLTNKQAKSLAKANAKNDKAYKQASKKEAEAIKKREKALKNYEKDTGKKYGTKSTGSKSKSKTRGSSSSKKATAKLKAKTSGEKKVKKLSDSVKKASKGKNNVKVKAKTSGGKKVKKLSDDVKKASKGKNNVKVKAKVSGDKKVKNLSKSAKKLKNKNVKVKAKVSGDKKVKKLSKETKKLKNKNLKVKAKVSGDKKVKTLSKNTKKLKNKNVKVKARVSGDKKVKSLSKETKKLKNKNVKVRAGVSGQSKAKSLASAIKKLKSKSVKVTAHVSGSTGKIKSLNSAIRSLRGKTVKAGANVSGAGKVKSLSSAINAVKSKTVQVTASVTGTAKVKALTAAINALKGKSVNVTANVNGLGQVRSLVSAIASVHSKSVTISAHMVKSGGLATGTPGATSAFRGALASGTPASTTTKWSSNGGAKAGTYLVNDAPGPNYVEAFKLKNGLIGLFPKQRNIVVPLPEGTQVLNGKETKRLFPRLAEGTPKFGKVLPQPKAMAYNTPELRLERLETGTPTFDMGTIENNFKTSNKTVNNVSRSAKSSSKSRNVVVNMTNNFTINAQGNGQTDWQSVIDKISNAIGEKFRQQFPQVEI